MKLLNMKLENFKGIRNAEFSLNGNDTTFRGTNGAGKTTIADAMSWLLTGKKFSVNENLNPKTYDENGEFFHNLEHSVECTYKEDDGTIITLKKTMKEKYTKKRGATTSEFAGHTIEYKIDGVPTKEKEFNELITQKFGSLENVMILSNINYFANMDWKKRRKILLEMCGDYSDDYIIANNPQLLELKNILLKKGTENQFYTVDEFMKMSKSKLTDTNKEIQSIPARIDEATRAIPDVANLSKEELQIKLNEINVDIDKLKEENMLLLNNDNEKAKQEKIHDIQMKIKDARVSYQDKAYEENHSYKLKVDQMSSEINELQNRLSNTNSRIVNASNDLNYTKQQREKLISEYSATQAQNWDSTKETCPTCKQTLPYDQIEKLKEEFNLNKSNKLAEINERGQRVSEDVIKEQQELIDKLNKEVETIGTELVLKKQSLDSFVKNKPQIAPFEATKEYQLLNEELLSVTSVEVENVSAQEIENNKKKIELLEQQKTEKQTELSYFDTVDYQNNRIKELKATQKQLAIAYEDIEKQIYLCEEFIKAKVNMITENINNKFKNVSFRLFEQQINGGLKECCDVMVPIKNTKVFVPFNDGSNLGANMNAGLEMIEVFSKYINKTLPVFVDNAESVVELNKYQNLQVIKLVVDGSYQKLTMIGE